MSRNDSTQAFNSTEMGPERVIAETYRSPRSFPLNSDTTSTSRFLAQVKRIVWVLSTRGGDFDLQLGMDVAIGYLSHDADTVELYLQETLTFLVYTAEASVALTP